MNGTVIQDDERRGAEYDYLKKYALEWLKIQNEPGRDRFLSEHNRYLELIESKNEILLNTSIINRNIFLLHFEKKVKRSVYFIETVIITDKTELIRLNYKNLFYPKIHNARFLSHTFLKVKHRALTKF